MSGHSKWSTIKHQKGAKDARRGKLFAKLIRAIEIAAREVEGPPQDLLGVLDVRVRRNAFGRQVASFEAEVDVKGVDGGPVSGAFIRAPWVADAGPEVEVLAEVEGKVVAVRQGNLLATAFHPELSGEVRLHRWLVDLVRGQAENQVGERGAS